MSAALVDPSVPIEHGLQHVTSPYFAPLVAFEGTYEIWIIYYLYMYIFSPK